MTRPGHDAARAGQRGLLIHHLAAQPQLDRPRVVAQRAELAGGVAHLGQDVGWHAEQLTQVLVEAGRAEPVELRARGGGVVGGEAGPEPVAQERVDGAHPQRAGVARALHRLVVLEQPGELGGGEVGVERQPAERLDLLLRVAHPVEHLLRALVLPDHDRRQRLAGLGVPREHRLALVVEPAGDHLLVGPLEQLANGLDDRLEHLIAVLFNPPSLWVGCGLVAARLAHGLQPLVEQGRLDAGRSLVDAQEKHLRLLPHAGPLRLVSRDGSR